jgi:hypothetical protein
MDIFLSWSGVTSKRVAEQLKQFLPSVIQSIKPFYSSDDISKGKRWSAEISNKLQSCELGIIILTKDNLKAPWIMFESGALSKNITTGRVCTLLLGISDTDVQSPLTEFQNTKFIKDDVHKLLHDINSMLAKSAIDNAVLTKTFNKMWPDLEHEVNTILSEDNVSNEKEKITTDRELLEESVRYLRQMNLRHIMFNRDDFDFSKGSQVIFDIEDEHIAFYDQDKELYSIHIHQLSDTAEVMDFFFQISQKGWCNPDHIKGFLECIEEVSKKYFGQNAQGVFSPYGEFRKIDWINRESKPIKIKEE